METLKNNKNMLLGSILGLSVGVITYLILNYIGLPLGNLESSVIIAFPALLAILTSFAIF